MNKNNKLRQKLSERNKKNQAKQLLRKHVDADQL